MIQWLSHHQINFSRWEECVRSSPNGMVNVLPWYLNIAVPGWGALVLNDYEAVMALPIKHKKGIPFLYNPNFVRQLGIFSSRKLTTKEIHDFHKEAIKRVPYYSFFSTQESSEGISQQRVFQSLFLNEKLEMNENTKRNIKKASKLALQWDENLSSSDVMSVYLQNRGGAINHTEHDLKIMRQLMKQGLVLKQGKAVGFRNEKGELLTAAYFFFFEKTIYYLIGSVNEEGKKGGVMHLLFHQIMEQYAKQFEIFDFGGSNIPSVSQFYRGLGGKDAVYYHTEGGFLKPILKLLKVV